MIFITMMKEIPIARLNSISNLLFVMRYLMSVTIYREKMTTNGSQP